MYPISKTSQSSTQKYNEWQVSPTKLIKSRWKIRYWRLWFTGGSDNLKQVIPELKKDLFLDRENEKIIYNHVSKEGLGPKIYCYIGEHTRIEEFIESRVLKSEDMLAP